MWVACSSSTCRCWLLPVSPPPILPPQTCYHDSTPYLTLHIVLSIRFLLHSPSWQCDGCSSCILHYRPWMSYRILSSVVLTHFHDVVFACVTLEGCSRSGASFMTHVEFTPSLCYQALAHTANQAFRLCNVNVGKQHALQSSISGDLQTVPPPH